MDRTTFNQLLRDLLPRLHDMAVLETHPLAAAVEMPPGFRSSRGEYLRMLVLEAIEGLQPAGVELSASAVEWRPYLILHKRYVVGEPLPRLAAELSLSERQVRRDHNRALQALAARLWDQAFRPAIHESELVEGMESAGSVPAYEIHPEVLDLNAVVGGLASILHKRVNEEEVDLQIDLAVEAPRALGDRIILRQILISLFNYALHLQAGKTIRLCTRPGGTLLFELQVDADWRYWQAEEHDDYLTSARYWAEKLNARLQERYPDEAGLASLSLSLPLAGEATILVVDDQDPAVRMFQRYLSNTGFKVVGVADPHQVLALAREIQPVLITLDVMMPYVDGWELLQALQLDNETRHIPVLVCSAWEEPELARSLGAVGYLKKPVTQKDLLGVLESVNLLP